MPASEHGSRKAMMEGRRLVSVCFKGPALAVFFVSQREVVPTHTPLMLYRPTDSHSLDDIIIGVHNRLTSISLAGHGV